MEQRIKIFIIDDDRDILNLYSKIFELNGFHVVGMASNGVEALNMLKDSIPKPDIIIIDYYMPIINGIETAQRILEIDNSFRIIMISADSSIEGTAILNGITEFYKKPFEFKTLCSRIKQLIQLN